MFSNHVKINPYFNLVTLTKIGGFVIVNTDSPVVLQPPVQTGKNILVYSLKLSGYVPKELDRFVHINEML